MNPSPSGQRPTPNVQRLTVRPAAPDDLPLLVALLRAVVAGMQRAGIDQWDDIYPTADVLSDDVAHGTIYVTGLGATAIAGAVVLDERQAPEYRGVRWTFGGDKIGVVHRLMVDPANQRHGVARELMRFVERRARELGYAAIRLDAFTRNPGALRLYEGLGYRDAGPVTLRKGLFRCFEKAIE